MIRGRDLNNPLRHLSDATLVPGLSLQFDMAGHWLVKTKSKQASMETRPERKEKRSTTKMWCPLSVDFFTSKLEFSPLENIPPEPCPQPSSTSSPSTVGRFAKSRLTQVVPSLQPCKTPAEQSPTYRTRKKPIKKQLWTIRRPKN